MAVPRLLQGGEPAWLYVGLAFLCMTFVAGAATAWGTTAGMVGLFPCRRRLVAGLIAGAVAGLVLIPVFVLWLDPWHKEALLRLDDTARLGLQFPDTPWQKVAIVLWAAGFQVLFFEAASMSFFCRLTGRLLIALSLAVAFRIFVSHLQMADLPVDSAMPFYLVYGLTSVTGCVLFARAGLPAASVFAASLAIRHFWAG